MKMMLDIQAADDEEVQLVMRVVKKINTCERCGNPCKRPQARFCGRQCASRTTAEQKCLAQEEREPDMGEGAVCKTV